jgi:hypothetical protein
MAIMNAANSSKGHDRAAAIRRLGNDERRARGVRMRHSEQRLRARIRRTIRAQWNLNVALRRPVPRASQTSATLAVGHSRMRPCSSLCWYCRCCSVRSLDGAIRILVPMRSRSAWCWCATQRTIHARWCQARPHRCGVRRCRQLHAVGPRLRVGTASLPRGVCRRSSAASVLRLPLWVWTR